MESKPDIIGYVGTGISLIGAIGALVFNKPAAAGIPVAVGVSCNTFSRSKLSTMLVESYDENKQAIANLTTLLEKNQEELNSSIKINQANLSEQIKILQRDLTKNIDTTKTEFNEQIFGLKTQYEKINEIVSNLAQIENASQELRVKPNSCLLYTSPSPRDS